jgi:hypothetical protein
MISERRTGAAIQLSCECGWAWKGRSERRAEEAENGHIRYMMNPSYAPRDREWRATYGSRTTRDRRGFWQGFGIGALLGFLFND